MNLNFRKTALLAGICSVFSLGYTPQLFAVSSVDTVVRGIKRNAIN